MAGYGADQHHVDNALRGRALAGRPITRNIDLCGTPDGSATVTRARPPSRAPVLRIVAAPSTICWSPPGRCPSPADIRAGPRTAVTASARTRLPLTSTSTRAASVIRLIALSRRRLSSSGPVTTAWAPGSPFVAKYAWYGVPYKAGEETRCVRLAPNTAVAHSAATAITVPSNAVPTGMGCAPRLRSSAYWTPISTLGGAPVTATALTRGTAAVRGGSRPPSNRA